MGTACLQEAGVRFPDKQINRQSLTLLFLAENKKVTYFKWRQSNRTPPARAWQGTRGRREKARTDNGLKGQTDRQRQTKTQGGKADSGKKRQGRRDDEMLKRGPGEDGHGADMHKQSRDKGGKGTAAQIQETQGCSEDTRKGHQRV